MNLFKMELYKIVAKKIFFIFFFLGLAFQIFYSSVDDLGTNYLGDIMWMSAVITDLLIVIGLAPVFADEYEQKMDSMIFTTINGKKKDIIAKLLASLMICVSLFLLLSVITIIIYGWRVGLDQMHLRYGDLNKCYNQAIADMTMLEHLRTVFLMSLGAKVLFYATIFVCSRKSHRKFDAFAIAVGIYLLPILLWQLLRYLPSINIVFRFIRYFLFLVVKRTTLFISFPSQIDQMWLNPVFDVVFYVGLSMIGMLIVYFSFQKKR